MPLSEKNIIWDKPSESNIKWDAQPQPPKEDAAKSYVEKQVTQTPSLQGHVSAGLAEGKSYAQISELLKDFETERTAETQPWIDPTIAASGGFGGAGKMALSRGATPIGAAIKGFLGGTTAAATEPISGGLAGEVAKKYPRAALPVNLLAGGLLGAGLEAPFERIISRTAGRAMPKMAAKIAPKVPVAVKPPKEADIKWDVKPVVEVEPVVKTTPEVKPTAPEKAVAVETPIKQGVVPAVSSKAHLEFLEDTFDQIVDRGGKVFTEPQFGGPPEVRGFGSDSITTRWTEGSDFSKAQARSAIKAALGKSKKEITPRQQEIVEEITQKSKADFDTTKQRIDVDFELAEGQKVEIDGEIFTKRIKNNEVFLEDGETLGPLPDNFEIRVDKVLPREGEPPLLKAQEARIPRRQPTQPDFIGAREGLEGRIPTEDIPIERGGLFDIEGRKQTQAQIEAAKRQGVLPEKGILDATIGEIASEEGALTLMKTPIRDAMEVQKTSTVEKVQRIFDDQRSATESVNKMKPKEWLGRLNRAIVDVSGNAKNTLIKKAGKEGQRAVMEHDLIAGASAKANLEVGEVIDSMTKGLKKEQYEYMNDFIQAKRAIAISKYKKDFKHAGGIEAKEYAEWMDSLPKETRAVLEERSIIFFDTMKKKLGELRKEGLITEEGFSDLVSKGDYAPRSLRKYIDFEESMQFGGKKISVEGAGIKRLKQGDVGLLENDSELMLREVVGRVEHRIARNRANRALHDIAKVDPNNSIVKIGKVKAEFYVKNKAKDKAIKKFRDPKKAHEARLKFKNPDDYEVIRKDVPRDKLQPHEDYVNVVIDGKTIPLVLNKEFARDWVTRETVIDPNVANLVQWASGSKILRPLATGINPAFALTNLPRDMARALVVSEEFSPHLPIGFAQLIKDMSAVVSDSVLRKGRYRDYINEGGGMSFLTHQGQTFKPGSTMAKVGSYLGYLGETSEILVRLAIRERSVKNSLRREGQVGLGRMREIQREATYEARNQLDFSQGGWLTKAVDNAVPYLNAAVQGTRGMFRAAKKNPKRFAYQMGQIGALSSGIYYMNHFLNGEAYSQISDRDKANNWIITTPFWFRDNQGNKRYYFGKIPKDQSQRVFAAMFEGLSAKFIGEDINVDMTVQTITDLTPVGPTDFLPPTIEAALGYAANKDFWRNEDIWKSRYGGEVEPKEEYTPYTHPFFVQTGEVTGLSPERLKFALSQVFTHSNIYTDMGGYLWKQAFSNMPESAQERTSEEIILNKPGIRRLVEATNPYYAHEKQVREAKTKASTERLRQNRELDTLSQQYINGDIDKNQLLGFIRGAAPQDRRRLSDRHRRRVKIKDLPNRRWWLDIAEMSPEARALEFYRVYNDSSKTERQEMWGNAKKVPGMTSDRFRREIFRLIRGGSE